MNLTNELIFYQSRVVDNFLIYGHENVGRNYKNLLY